MNLRFPAVEKYSPEEMAIYNEEWHEIGDVREWERLGYRCTCLSNNQSTCTMGSY